MIIIGEKLNGSIPSLFSKNKSYWNYIFADIVLTCIPVIIVYMIGKKYIVGGMTSGVVIEKSLYVGR